MIRKIGHIFQGWGKALGQRLGLISLSTSEQKLTELRLKICKACKYAVTRKFIEILNDDEDHEVEGLVCSRCHCPCKEKALVIDEKCPEDLW